LPEKTRRAVITILNDRLADAIDLQSQVKQAHWNVKGPHCIALHELFDKISDVMLEQIDQIAERVTSLGGTAEGTVAVAAKRSKLKNYPLSITAGKDHLFYLSTQLSVFGKAARTAIDDTGKLRDADTAGLFTGMSRDLDKYLWFVEAHLQDGSAGRALGILRGLLTVDETLEACAMQHRVYALTHRRLCIAATSGRFISLTRRLLGGYDSADIRWQDLKETRIRAGLLTAELTLVAQTSTDLNIGAETNRVWSFPGLCKDQAQAIYRICQQHDQVWREKRRIRELEELRAKSGGVQLGGAGYSSPDASGESEPTRRLRQAREMLDAKLISDAEFESIKAKIVSGL
jgi:DNA-binding ferritin-like protein